MSRKQGKRADRRGAALLGFMAGALAIPAGTARAEDATSSRWDVTASVRARYETFDGGYRPGGRESDDALSLRSSLAIGYRGDGFEAGFELRDSRAYAIDESTPLGSGDIDALEIAQAWVRLPLGDSARLTAGRMLLNIGSKRLVGDPGFRNAANAFTGVRIDWKSAGADPLAVTAFYTLPDIRRPDDKQELADNHFRFDVERLELRFWGVHAARAVGGVDGELYVLGLDEDDYRGTATRNRHLVTLGARLRGTPAPALSYELEGMAQLGTIRTSSAPDAARVPVRAWSTHAEIGYRFADGWKPQLTLFADLASGDKAGTRAYERFDLLYGPRRGDWGPAALFGPLGRSNITSAGVRLNAAPSKRLDGFVEWRRMGLMSATDAFAFTRVVDREGLSGRDAGSQFQALVRYWVLPRRLQLELAAAVLDKGPFLRNAPNAPDAGDTHYGYVSLLYTL
ncbi:alginate export family protein [Novosphingobium sp. 1949]|uniref:Alginate export family protein n=1 Tax=Novosphingobium organovorum TaxID=2930092 RepID=A0ABT0BFI1_9SPHN|nr:alginate export family protein [Novosphingobium organovorum]MCJ2183539.1 alginate export family protein [Novosphingobium organovorum]